MKNKKMENSVRSLINLYTVVMGVALSLAITQLIDSKSGLAAVTVSSSLLFVAFITTLFPFYHGALRHLDDAYIENENAHIRDGALVVDFLLLLLHGIGFVILSILIAVPNHFAWALVVLLSIDVIWGVFVHFGPSSQDMHAAEWKWTIINFVFVGLAVWYLVGNGIYMEPIPEQLKLAIPIAIACTLRTLVDYVWGKQFYFPKP